MVEMKGTISLFRVAGVDVRLHWLWFLIAVYEVLGAGERYSSLAWNAVEYLSLFGMVLLHEFGHVLACRSVGGKADRILLWPLGGIAFVEPPPRPGANLWTLAAGPLVNLALAPLLVGFAFFAGFQGWDRSSPDLYQLAVALAVIDVILLVFNMLPIYPLDGGRIFRALLWFVMGRTRSLAVASAVGFIGVGGLVLLAVAWADVWIGIIAFFVFFSCVGGWRYARNLARSAKTPRRSGYACPKCSVPPATGALWFCESCGREIDPFAGSPLCPKCQAKILMVSCYECEATTDSAHWKAEAPAPA